MKIFINRALADRDADGKMDATEFAIAMHLIELKIKGFDIPKTLPPSIGMPAATIIPGMPTFRPPVALAGKLFTIIYKRKFSLNWKKINIVKGDNILKI